MTPEQSAHLSEEAINDCLIGLGSPQSEAHLAVCVGCSSRVKEFQTDMAAFNQTTLAWSESRPRTNLHSAPAPRTGRIAVLPLGWALAAALLVVIGFPVWNHYRSAVHTAPAAGSASVDSEAQIAQDNDLLQSVNVALNEDEESPVAVYHLSEAPHPRSKARSELRKQ
jgi:hypothetical protein